MVEIQGLKRIALEKWSGQEVFFSRVQKKEGYGKTPDKKVPAMPCAA
jgi:hypothetical protein